MFHIEFGPPSVDCLCVCLRYVLNGGMSSLGHGHWMMGGGRSEVGGGRWEVGGGK